MDTSDYPSLPSLTRIHAQLAAQARRVDQVLVGPSDVIERLFHATIAEDWNAVTEATRELANLKPEEMGVEVISEARKLYQELSHDAQVVKQPKHLAPLLAACRTARSRTRSV